MPNDPPATLFNARPQPVPPGTGMFGMVLFLAALAMLFGGSLAGYLFIRFSAPDAPELGSVHLPWGLWVSTVVILASSYTMHRALQAVRHERQTPFRNTMLLTALLAVLFLVVQTPSLMAIMHEHLPRLQAYAEAREQAMAESRMATGARMPLEGLVFVLILVHALHVIGGVIPMAVVAWRAQHGRYDHEHHAPVRYLALYWHFLDAVWIIMFIVLLVAS